MQQVCVSQPHFQTQAVCFKNLPLPSLIKPTLSQAMPGFSMTACAKPNKRALDDAASPASKIPRASDVVVEQATPRSTAAVTTSTRPNFAPIQVCIWKYTDRAGDLLPAFADKPDVRLYQIQICHNQRNSIDYQFRQRFERYIASSGQDIPTTLAELEAEAGIMIRVSGPSDIERGAVSVPWRPCIYVAAESVEAVQNALLLVDGFVCKEAKPVDGQPLQIQLHPHESVGAISTEECQYEHIVNNEPANDLPLDIFDGPRPRAKAPVIFTLQLTSPELMSVVISGPTWEYRQQFLEAGVGGGYANKEADPQDAEARGPYLRIMKDLNTGEEESKELVRKVLTEVMNNLAVRMVVDSSASGKLAEDAPNTTFIKELREMPSVHFHNA